MHLEDATVIRHDDFQGGYRLLTMESPRIAPEVLPGQFVHLKIPHLEDALLRRPFSVYQTEGARLAILYKNIGKGTDTMTALRVGESVSLIGPLGTPFPPAGEDSFPVLVAGGYGMAALYLVARTLPTRGVAFFGGASSPDILCVGEFESLGWEVRVATEDGSLGMQGVVTDALDEWLEQAGPDCVLEFYACGPNAMLRAVGDRAQAGGSRAWISMDRNMGCGVGACLTCVQRVRAEDGTDWAWARACTEGPVFECRHIVWEEE